MGTNVETEKPALTERRASMVKQNGKENMFEKKGKAAQRLSAGGRYFSKKADENIDDENGRKSSICSENNIDEDNIKMKNCVTVANEGCDDGGDNSNTGSEEDNGPRSNNDGSAGSSGDDDDDGNKEESESDDNGDAGSNDDGAESNNDGTEEEDDDGIGSGGGGDDDGHDDEEEEESEGNDDEESMEDSEEEIQNVDNVSKNAVPSKKQKTTNKQQNNSKITKKVTTSVHRLPKFQGTAKTSIPNQQLEDTKLSTKKRKISIDKLENESAPEKKLCVVDNKTEHLIGKQNVLDDNTGSLIEQRKEERDVRSLFLKNLPANTTEEIVKKLSPEIINVRIPLENGKNLRSLYAFIEFENEDAAERNYKNIKEKKIGNKKFIVDFCGEKSNFKKEAPKKNYIVNQRRLFIPNVPGEITVDDLKKRIPEAKNFTSKLRGTKRLVFISFENKEIAKKAFEEAGKLVVRGKKLTVLYAYKKKPPREVSTIRQKKWSNIVPQIFDDEDIIETTEMKTKDESKDSIKDDTETIKIGKKRNRRRKKNNLVSNLETQSKLKNKDFKADNEVIKAKGKKRNFKKKKQLSTES